MIKNLTKEQQEQREREQQKSSYLHPKHIPDNGSIRFRILGPGIAFFQGWLKEEFRHGDNKPIRWSAAPGEPEPQIPQDQWDAGQYGNAIQYFFTYPIWNWEVNQLQVLQINQSTIRAAIEAAEEKYGDLRKFDVQIRKSVKGGRTSYEFSMCPEHKDMTEIIIFLEDVPCNIDALLDNENPFEEGQDPLDLSFFKNTACFENTEQEQPPKQPPKTVGDWGDYTTTKGVKLKDMPKEELIEIRNRMQEKEMTSHQAYKHVCAGVKWHLEQEINEEIPF